MTNQSWALALLTQRLDTVLTRKILKKFQKVWKYSTTLSESLERSMNIFVIIHSFFQVKSVIHAVYQQLPAMPAVAVLLGHVIVIQVTWPCDSVWQAWQQCPNDAPWHSVVGCCKVHSHLNLPGKIQVAVLCFSCSKDTTKNSRNSENISKHSQHCEAILMIFPYLSLLAFSHKWGKNRPKWDNHKIYSHRLNMMLKFLKIFTWAED